jgi:hypothetical protein
LYDGKQVAEDGKGRSFKKERESERATLQMSERAILQIEISRQRVIQTGDSLPNVMVKFHQSAENSENCEICEISLLSLLMVEFFDFLYFL